MKHIGKHTAQLWAAMALCMAFIPLLRAQNVGIGQPNPLHKLDVSGEVIRINTPNALGDIWTYYAQDNTLRAALGYRNSIGAAAVFVNGADRMVVTNAGLVGMGFTAPEGALHIGRYRTEAQAPFQTNGSFVYGDERSSLIITQRLGAFATGLGYPAGLIDFRGTNASNQIASLALIGAAVDPNGGSNWSGGLYFYTSPGGTNVPPGERNRGAAPIIRMAIDHQGYVGIGTTTPVARLQVQGNAITGGYHFTKGDIYMYTGVSPANRRLPYDVVLRSSDVPSQNGVRSFTCDEGYFIEGMGAVANLTNDERGVLAFTVRCKPLLGLLQPGTRQWRDDNTPGSKDNRTHTAGCGLNEVIVGFRARVTRPFFDDDVGVMCQRLVPGFETTTETIHSYFPALSPNWITNDVYYSFNTGCLEGISHNMSSMCPHGMVSSRFFIYATRRLACDLQLMCRGIIPVGYQD